MPYLDQPWQAPEGFFPLGEWVPEVDRRGWIDRHSDLPYASWVKREGLTPGDLSYLQTLQPQRDERLKYLEALGADIGSVQRDGFLYANFLEQLKQAIPALTGDTAADQIADNIVERMKTMRLTSANLDEELGEPPPPQSPRPWRAVINWLSRLLQQVGLFLVNSIQAFVALIRELMLDANKQIAISFSAGIPPAVAFQFICPRCVL